MLFAPLIEQTPFHQILLLQSLTISLLQSNLPSHILTFTHGKAPTDADDDDEDPIRGPGSRRSRAAGPKRSRQSADPPGQIAKKQKIRGRSGRDDDHDDDDSSDDSSDDESNHGGNAGDGGTPELVAEDEDQEYGLMDTILQATRVTDSEIYNPSMRLLPSNAVPNGQEIEEADDFLGAGFNTADINDSDDGDTDQPQKSRTLSIDARTAEPSAVAALKKGEDKEEEATVMQEGLGDDTGTHIEQENEQDHALSEVLKVITGHESLRLQLVFDKDC
ncbi:hypothetical protein EJ03DRAFT_381897 [Teratosphaeria nubilosa]|uniref:Uncharacterized protein n=1 Tax=Teratosphaeria nubilosa TaxID=161662 RepID=A0A6G1LCT2_9PEZI|nr:hypothetical protein EJ03DRAFT_381897 [Teratosphaeria nubilosa]